MALMEALARYEILLTAITVKVQMKCFLLLPNSKEQQKS